MSREFPTRLSIPIQRETKIRMNNTIPDGVRAAFIRSILELGLDAIDAHGHEMLGAILNGPKHIRIIPRNDS